MTALLDAALALAGGGWRVFPLYHPLPGGRCSCPDSGCVWPGSNNPGKHPISELAPHGHLDATTDPKAIREWWRRWPLANIGVSCAASGFLALDVDPRHEGDATIHQLTLSHGRLPLTVTARTGGDGWHLLFKLPEGALRGELGEGLEVKARGYIVVAPSLHPSGRCYRWLDGRAPGDLPLSDLPPAWLDLVVKPERRPEEIGIAPVKWTVDHAAFAACTSSIFSNSAGLI